MCDDPDYMSVLWLYKLFIWLIFLKYYSPMFVTHHIQIDSVISSIKHCKETPFKKKKGYGVFWKIKKWKIE